MPFLPTEDYGARAAAREEILYTMSEANWPYDDALRLVSRIGTRQRRKWILVIIGCGLLVVFGVGITYLSLTSTNGGAVYLPISGLVSFIYGLVRLVKLRI